MDVSPHGPFRRGACCRDGPDECLVPRRRLPPATKRGGLLVHAVRRQAVHAECFHPYFAGRVGSQRIWLETGLEASRCDPTASSTDVNTQLANAPGDGNRSVTATRPAGRPARGKRPGRRSTVWASPRATSATTVLTPDYSVC